MYVSTYLEETLLSSYLTFLLIHLRTKAKIHTLFHASELSEVKENALYNFSFFHELLQQKFYFSAIQKLFRM